MGAIIWGNGEKLKIDTQGWPFICPGFEFDASGPWGTIVMTVDNLDLEWNTGTAKNGNASVHLEKINGDWHWVESLHISDKESDRALIKMLLRMED